MQARRTTASQETKQIDAAAIVVATTTHVQMATKDQVNWRFFLLSAKEYFVWLKSQALEKIKRPLYEKHPMSKFAWTIAEDTDSMEWYNICQDALRKVNESYQGKETAGIIQNKVLQDWNIKYWRLEQIFGLLHLTRLALLLVVLNLAHELEVVEDAEFKFI
ncbi:uncharacterized protein LOC127148560 isoform X2 [Cucumis melo]|uniref:Uncharacterized protein LOC127148560 isoform X2 n=1 Tax=Cucumis melo TaxID=3656 RepID=A0ABM3KLF5_CUCME|nr:uncharacterized protein LOC127148560 isoform X2 [Cucumis melo]